MTYESVIRALSDGKAAKVASWGGYVYRNDVTEDIKEFSVETEYKVGDLVIYLYDTYICKMNCCAGEWDPEVWERTHKFKMTFRSRRARSSGEDDITYMYTPVYRNGMISYDVKPISPNTTGGFKMLCLDGELMQAFQSSEWLFGPISEFEQARIGTNQMW